MRLLISALVLTTSALATDPRADGRGAPWDAESYRITGLRQFGSEDEMYSGYMPVSLTDNDRGALFFWMAKKRAASASPSGKKDKIVVWLNGGPGCSSMVGMMWENGPFHIRDGTAHSVDGATPKPYYLEKNDYSWNEEAHVIYLEQPIGTGFARAASGAAPVEVEAQVAADMFGFLQSFFTVFPDLAGQPLTISGESYAGAYIPWMADYIINQQRGDNDDSADMRANNGNIFINLQGVAIGNGVIDDVIQANSYAEYAYYHGLIPLAAKQRIDREYMRCLMAAEGGQQEARQQLYHHPSYSTGFKTKQNNGELIANTFDSCKLMEMVLAVAGQPNEYNTATFNGYDSIMASGGPFQNFFADTDIQSYLHVRGWDIPGINFIPKLGNNSDTAQFIVTDQFAQELAATSDGSFYKADFSDAEMGKLSLSTFGDKKLVNDVKLPSVPQNAKYYFSPNAWSVCSDVVADSMEKDKPVTTVPALQFIMKYIRVLLYSGEFDLNCNTLGTLHTLENAMWAGRMWNTAKRSLWRFQNDIQGEYFELEKLSFLIVRNSGHLLPMDLPEAALNLITRFISGETFADVPLPSENVYANDAAPIPIAGGYGHAANYASHSTTVVEDKERYFGGPDDGRGLKLFVTLSILLGGFFGVIYLVRHSPVAVAAWARGRSGSSAESLPYQSIPNMDMELQRSA